jgi:hypothetical protein
VGIMSAEGSTVKALVAAAVLAVLPAACTGASSPKQTHRPSPSPFKSTSNSGGSKHCPFGSRLSGYYLPPLELTPSRGPVGTSVRIDGEHFTATCWPYGAGPTSLFLSFNGSGAPPGCDLVRDIDRAARVGSDGQVSGNFEVPARGWCHQDTHNPPRRPRLRPGPYSVSLACTACFVGAFRLTAT